MSEAKDVDFDTENVEGDMDELENMSGKEENVQEEPKFDAKAIEQEMIDIAQNRTEDPAETAAMVYHMYRPEFIKRVTTLSSRAKSRLIAMLVQYPLDGGNVKFSSELEKEVYFLADSMIQAKFVLMLDTYKDSASELVKAQDEFFKGEISEEVVFNSVEELNEVVNEALNKEGE